LLETELEFKRSVEDVINGNDDAFRDLIKGVGPHIRNYLASNIFDHQYVDDVLQQTFISAYHNLETFDPSYSFKGWVYGIARNKLRQHLKKTYRDKEKLESYEYEFRTHIAETFEEQPLENIRSQVVKLQECMSKLGVKNQELVNERYFGKNSVKELAEKLGKTETSLSVTLYRVRATLRNCMEKAL